MNILKLGEPKPLVKEKTYTLTCEGCDTTISFKYSEGKYHRGLEWREVDYLTIACPVCHEVNRISTDRGR